VKIDILNLLAGCILGFVGGFFARWPFEKLSERRAFVRNIVDRYAARAQQNPDSFKEDEFLRMGTLQNLGAAELWWFEFHRVCHRIVLRGLKDPRKPRIDIFNDRRRRPRQLLRWAAHESVNLADQGAVLRIAAQEADAARGLI
jgi:hypothetical protein